MAKELIGRFPVQKARRPHVGEVHGEVGDGAVEGALLLWVARAEKEDTEIICAQKRLPLPPLPPRKLICTDRKKYATAATTASLRVHVSSPLKF